jgi:hypothetical protein
MLTRTRTLTTFCKVSIKLPPPTSLLPIPTSTYQPSMISSSICPQCLWDQTRRWARGLAWTPFS